MLITSIDNLRQRCKLPEEIPIESSECKRGSETDQPGSAKRPHAEDNERGLPSTKKQNAGPMIRFIQTQQANIPTEVTTIQPVLSSRERYESIHTPIGAILGEDLHDTSNEDSLVINSHLLPFVEAAFQRHSAAIDMWKKCYEDQLSKVHELQATNDGLREQLAAKKEISILKATCRKYKTTLDGEIGTNADLHARVQNLKDELNASKYTKEQALQAQKSARAELLEVKKELRMMQVLHQEVDEGYPVLEGFIADSTPKLGIG
ncbi:hypothetical protein R1flu_016265 [Riccia fluitans]|uniref:Uncharacterized protein n=1 Tax=Riccia fluitans TaxID=41844 RepID=A0ABD1YLE8_9MARC